METCLALHEFHQSRGARFAQFNGAEIVADYGDALAEHASLRGSAGVLDLSFRGRLCIVGGDRVRFLHGQVTNDVKKLRIGEGCYAALATAKGKMESDLNIFALADELLLDFEPGLVEQISGRLEKYIVADDAQIVDAAPHYGLLSVQGPKAAEVVRMLEFFRVPPSGGPARVNADFPTKPYASVQICDPRLGEVYLMNHARLSPGTRIYVGPLAPSGGEKVADWPGEGKSGDERISEPFGGFDLFIPVNFLGAVADKLIAAAKTLGGRACGWAAFETARIEAGIPRFGADMDETNFPLECGIEARAVSYSKGCYIGQEVINRIHTQGHVNRELRGLRLADDLKTLPARGEKLFHAGKEVGYVTSAVASPVLKANLALGYVRREANAVGTKLTFAREGSESVVQIVELPHVV